MRKFRRLGFRRAPSGAESRYECPLLAARTGAELALGAEVILTVPCIFHWRFSTQIYRVGVRMAVTSTPRRNGAHRLVDPGEDVVADQEGQGGQGPDVAPHPVGALGLAHDHGPRADGVGEPGVRGAEAELADHDCPGPQAAVFGR